MDKFADLTGRRYGLFEYHGAPDAERVIVLMGSGCEAAHETVDFLNRTGRKGGRAEGAPVPAFRCAPLRRSIADDGAQHRGARPHEGAGLRAASRSISIA